MTDAQTEARAIARGWTGSLVEIEEAIATALAAKDEEMKGWKKTATEYASELHSLRSQLAEARKALEQRDTDIAEFMGRLGSRWFLEQGWFPKSVGAREDDARRALEEQGGE